MRTRPIVKRLMALLTTSGLVVAAFLATTPGVVGFVANPPCTSANVSYSPVTEAAAEVGQTITLIASSTGCNVPAEYQFLLQAPGGTLVAKGPFSTTTTYIWNTTGLKIGHWNLVVRARAAGTSVPYDAYYTGTFNLWTNFCEGVTTSSPGSPQRPGNEVIFTASPYFCARASVRFLLLPPGGTWRVVREYSTDMNWDWKTAGYAPGFYEIGVWAREQGSTRRYDAVNIISMLLRPLPPNVCDIALLTVYPASPQAAGTSIRLTANAHGCGTPSYEFWVLAPGGVWTILQAYNIPQGFSTTLIYNWDTTGLANGQYQVGIWARNYGSTRSYEAYSTLTYYVGT